MSGSTYYGKDNQVYQRTTEFKQGQPVEFVVAVTSDTSNNVDVLDKTEISLEIYGTASSSVVDFTAQLLSGNSRPFSGLLTADCTLDSKGGMGQIWVFDVSGVAYFGINVHNIVGGNVTVKGWVG